MATFLTSLWKDRPSWCSDSFWWPGIAREMWSHRWFAARLSVAPQNWGHNSQREVKPEEKGYVCVCVLGCLCVGLSPPHTHPNLSLSLLLSFSLSLMVSVIVRHRETVRGWKLVWELIAFSFTSPTLLKCKIVKAKNIIVSFFKYWIYIKGK